MAHQPGGAPRSPSHSSAADAALQDLPPAAVYPYGPHLVSSFGTTAWSHSRRCSREANPAPPQPANPAGRVRAGA